MGNQFKAGQIVQGKVTGIQPYGAFVSLNDEVQGLVHISEITNGFVKNINDHLSVGDKVNVKILEIDEKNSKYSLSIRATEAKQPKPEQTANSQTGFNTMKDKLEKWINQSEERQKVFKN